MISNHKKYMIVHIFISKFNLFSTVKLLKRFIKTFYLLGWSDKFSARQEMISINTRIIILIKVKQFFCGALINVPNPDIVVSSISSGVIALTLD